MRENSEPFAMVAGYTLMRRSELDPIPLSRVLGDRADAQVTDDLYFHTTGCEWGYAPNYLALEPDPSGRTTNLPVERIGDLYRVDVPADATDYDWLEVQTAAPMGEDDVVVTDASGSPAHVITFRTLPGRPARVMVGNCPQWYGYGGSSLWISTQNGAEITGVRLRAGSD